MKLLPIRTFDRRSVAAPVTIAARVSRRSSSQGKMKLSGKFQDEGWSWSITDPGFNLSVGSARQYCYEKMP